MRNAVESAFVRVNVDVEVIDVESGEVVERQQMHNLVVKAGLNLLKTAMATGTAAYPTHMALGTGVTAIAAADTTLEGEVTREAITSRTTDPTEPQIIIHYYLGSTVGNGNTLRKAGLFTAAAAGTLYAAVLLNSPIVKTSSVAVSFTWTLTWGAS